MKGREWCAGKGQRKCFLTVTDKLGREKNLHVWHREKEREVDLDIPYGEYCETVVGSHQVVWTSSVCVNWQSCLCNGALLKFLQPPCTHLLLYCPVCLATGKGLRPEDRTPLAMGIAVCKYAVCMRDRGYQIVEYFAHMTHWSNQTYGSLHICT